MQMLPIVKELPAHISREIGRLMVANAYLEYVLGEIVLDLLKLDQKRGRVAIRQPRAGDTYDMIKDLAEIEKISFSPEIENIRTSLNELSMKRDWLAHGIWVDDKKRGLLLRITSGSWQPAPGTKGKIKRRILPEVNKFGLREIKATLELNDVITAVIMKFRTKLNLALRLQRRTSLDKRERLLLHPSLPLRPVHAKPKPPRKASAE